MRYAGSTIFCDLTTAESRAKICQQKYTKYLKEHLITSIGDNVNLCLGDNVNLCLGDNVNLCPIDNSCIPLENEVETQIIWLSLLR